MSRSSPWPFSEAWNAWAAPWKLPMSVAGARTSRTTCWTCDTAWLSDTPSLRLNEIVTDGSWPRWLTVSGPSAGVSRATASRGTSLACDERTYSRGNWLGSRWYAGSSSRTTQYWLDGVEIVETWVEP